MRAWIFLGVAAVLATTACGGDDVSSIDTDAGGNDTGVANDTGVTADTGTGNDSGSTGDSGTGDSGTGDSGTGDSGSWDPSQLSGLVLWLDAAKGVTQNNNSVSAWADQTSHKNDASGGQGNQSHMPTVVANVINGLPVIRFTPPQNNFQHQYLTIADNTDKSLQWGTGDFAIELVGSYTNPATGNGASFPAFFYKGGNTTSVQLVGNTFGGNATASMRAIINNATATSTSTTNNDGKPHRFAMRRAGTTLEIWVDGAKDSANNANGDITLATVAVDIGARGALNQYLHGDIAEMLAVQGTVSDNDLTALDTYLKAKYGL